MTSLTLQRNDLITACDKDQVYCLCAGLAVVRHIMPNGHHTVTRQLWPGDYFGLELFKVKPIPEVTVLAVSELRVFERCEIYPDLYRGSLATQLHRLSLGLYYRSAHKVKTRVLRHLLNLTITGAASTDSDGRVRVLVTKKPKSPRLSALPVRWLAR